MNGEYTRQSTLWLRTLVPGSFVTNAPRHQVQTHSKSLLYQRSEKLRPTNAPLLTLKRDSSRVWSHYASK